MAVYACTDLHGRDDLWKQIKDFLQPSDQLIFLGDAADRGDNGWEIIKELLDRPNTIYLRGNHEQLLLDRWPEDNYEGAMLHEYNGGHQTYMDMYNDPDNAIYMYKLRQSIFWYEFKNAEGKTIFCSHSGCINTNNKEDLLWHRYFWRNEDNFTGPYDKIIHGHTPMVYIQEDLGKPENIDKPFYYNKKYVCLDSGAYVTNIALLLNLDTFEYHRFVTDNG